MLNPVAEEGEKVGGGLNEWACTEDYSIRVFCVQFTTSACFIRVIVTALLEYIDNFIKIG